MNNDDWLAAGYKRYEVKDKPMNRLADFLLQKRFDDERGKKYFIVVYCYDKSKYPPPHNIGVGYMPAAQYSLGDNLPFFNVEMNGIEGWGGGVEGVEGWFDRLWVLFGRPYYERWEDA